MIIRKVTQDLYFHSFDLPLNFWRPYVSWYLITNIIKGQLFLKIIQSCSDSFSCTGKKTVKRELNNFLLSFIILTKFKNAYALDLNRASVSTTLSHTFQRETDVFISRLSEILACRMLLLLPCTLSQHMSVIEQLPKKHLPLNVSNNIGKSLCCFCLDLLCQLILCSLSRLGWYVKMWPLTISYAVQVNSMSAPNKLRIQILSSGQQY